MGPKLSPVNKMKQHFHLWKSKGEALEKDPQSLKEKHCKRTLNKIAEPISVGRIGSFSERKQYFPVKKTSS